MKYIVWVCAFFAYLLMFVGVFTLLGNITKGLEVEIEVEREIYGEIIARMQSVDFDDIPAALFSGSYNSLRWVLGTLALLITVGGGFLAASALSLSWSGSDNQQLQKTEKLMWIGTFAVSFFLFKFIFNISHIGDIFGLMGALFLAATCLVAYFLPGFLCKLFSGRYNAEVPAATNREVTK
ncbi:MAG: hypothetical protein FWH17_00265 [Oscillospiraceae bacterium]|nr:hypothetical protein [Oscillospiraceae bacterium]